jgi:hypothetical protein
VSDEPLSNFAFNFNLRRYTLALTAVTTTYTAGASHSSTFRPNVKHCMLIRWVRQSVGDRNGSGRAEKWTSGRPLAAGTGSGFGLGSDGGDDNDNVEDAAAQEAGSHSHTEEDAASVYGYTGTLL